MATWGNVEASLAPAKDGPRSKRKLKPSMTISGLAAEVFSVRFSPDGRCASARALRCIFAGHPFSSRYLAAGCGDGAVRVFNAKTGTVSQTLNTTSSKGLPCTILRFRPTGDGSRTKNVLLAANASGTIEHWHVTSGKCLHTLPAATDAKNDENQVRRRPSLPAGEGIPSRRPFARARRCTPSTTRRTEASSRRAGRTAWCASTTRIRARRSRRSGGGAATESTSPRATRTASSGSPAASKRRATPRDYGLRVAENGRGMGTRGPKVRARGRPGSRIPVSPAGQVAPLGAEPRRDRRVG